MDTINARISVKHDTTSNWNSATGFVPLEGEVIVYTDYQSYTTETNLYDGIANPIEQGEIESSNGSDTTSTTRVRTNGVITVSPNTEYTISTNMDRVFVLYYRYGSYTNQNSEWQTAPYTFITPSSANQIRVVLDDNNTAVSPSDFEWMKLVDPTQTETTNIPGIKIGSGNAYVQDLAFVDEDVRDRLMRHIADTDVHVTSAEKAFWNHKVDIDDAYDITRATLEAETLVFTRT